MLLASFFSALNEKISQMYSFPKIKQLDIKDCGPACLSLITRYYKRPISIKRLREACGKGQQGVSLLGITKAAENLGFRTSPVKASFRDFKAQATLPCVVHWDNNHFVVIWKITRKHLYISDPAVGKYRLSEDEFKTHWCPNRGIGIALFLNPTESFYSNSSEKSDVGSFKSLLKYLPKDKRLIYQLGLSVIIGAFLSLLFPMLTQLLIDKGIGLQNPELIFVIVLGQFGIFFGKICADFLRSWLLIHLGSRLGISIAANFLTKLVTLPLAYFNTRNLGDVLQRVQDTQKVEQLLTSHALNVVFSSITLCVFSLVMLFYSKEIFFIFLIGSIFSAAWLIIFLSRFRLLDHEQFAHSTANQNAIVEMVSGMHELRINQSISRKKWCWENIQAKLYRLKLKALALEQYQTAGVLFFNEGKNILITFIAANQVVNGQLSMGMLIAITYILGQLNGPLEQLLSFVRVAQDAKISLERLTDIQNMQSEDENKGNLLTTDISNGDIELRNVSFRYNRHDPKAIFENLSLTIPLNKMTAIVGASGSGKSTLLKLLLKFDEIDDGSICVAGQDLRYVATEYWRNQCGVVMQNGHIFSDTVLFNIGMGCTQPDISRVMLAAKIANIHDEIERLPHGYNTEIGLEGVGLSGGQQQRILIARAIYKQPPYLFFDEATSALDAANEKHIQENLQYVFKGKTAVVIAHRLSTVKNADQIIVLDRGRVAEVGHHEQLCDQRGQYYRLVKDQLALGS